MSHPFLNTTKSGTNDILSCPILTYSTLFAQPAPCKFSPNIDSARFYDFGLLRHRIVINYFPILFMYEQDKIARKTIWTIFIVVNQANTFLLRLSMLYSHSSVYEGGFKAIYWLSYNSISPAECILWSAWYVCTVMMASGGTSGSHLAKQFGQETTIISQSERIKFWMNQHNHDAFIVKSRPWLWMLEE